MKILKIFGLVVGVHVFALVLIFANPGCSSSTKPAPAPADTAATPPPPRINVPMTSPTPAASPAPSSPAITFNPDVPAASTVAANSGGVRYTPTRPGSPVAGTLVAEPVADVTPAATYTVKSGDSLWTVAKKHHLTVAQVAAANSLQANAKLQPGQKLLIPGKPTAPATAATATATSTPPVAHAGKSLEPAAASRPAAASGSAQLKHVVKPGESLGAIARIYGVPVREIAVANNITDPAKVKAGAELIIPGWDPAPSKSGKSGAAKSSGSAAKSTPAAPAKPPVIEAEPAAPVSVPTVPVIDIERSNSIVPAPKP